MDLIFNNLFFVMMIVFYKNNLHKNIIFFVKSRQLSKRLYFCGLFIK